jgi:hypothetical protein
MIWWVDVWLVGLVGREGWGGGGKDEGEDVRNSRASSTQSTAPHRGIE